MKNIVPSADGTPVHYETLGAGAPALVFVHGWSCDRSYWSRQLPYFARRHQVVAVDLAGHGESGSGRKARTMHAFGNDVVAVVDQLGLNRMVLVGHSMGGDVIVHSALKLRERVVGLVWADVYSTLGTPGTPEEIAEFAAPFREDFATTTRNLVRTMFLPSSRPSSWSGWWPTCQPRHRTSRSMRSSIHSATRPPSRMPLSTSTAPVVAINPGYRPTDVEALQRHGVRSVMMPGVGHFEMMEDPDTFNRLLEQTIDEFVG